MIIENKIKYIHIPRTGGKFLKESLSKALNVDLPHGIDKDFDIEGMHLHYPLYLEDADLEYFTVIRDPFERLTSLIKIHYMFYEKNIFDLIKLKKYFFLFIENHRKDYSVRNNWYRPQVDFIHSKTKIWHYSLGYGEKFNLWFKEQFNISLSLIETSKTKEYTNIDITQEMLSLREYCYEYYEKDYILSQKVLKELQ